MMTEDNVTVLVEDEEEANCVDQVANHHKHDPEQGLAFHLAIGKVLVQSTTIFGTSYLLNLVEYVLTLL
jgi:hypothetical protein